MKVLVIGGGGREHAIVHTLKKSPKVDHIWCAPGNGGIAAEAECVAIKATDIDGMVAFAKEHKPDLVMVAPDDPLALGMVDALEAAGSHAFGRRKNAAVIEGSKSFAKDLMQKYNIPTAGYAVFENSADAIEYIKKNGAPIVVKADGLALGKGVTVAMTEEEAIEAVKDAIDGGAFGGAGARVVIEEFLTGPEVSVLAFVDGKHLKTMPSAQDHKRAYDHDEGPNTGGMGAFSPSRFYTDDIAAECMETIFKPTVAAMEKEGRPFKGVLYFGLMLTPKGPRVIAYNARFGDPETQAVLTGHRPVRLLQGRYRRKARGYRHQVGGHCRLLRLHGVRRLSEGLRKGQGDHRSGRCDRLVRIPRRHRRQGRQAGNERRPRARRNGYRTDP